jgi:branched-chain amino acid transport system ATP-binding protein
MAVSNILHCENITVKFGGVIANNNVSLHIEEGKVIGLIGPNGAGKTTLFNVLSKFQQHDTGHVYINNQLIDSKGPSDMVGLGMARTFQNINLFSELTTLDNILLGAHRLTGNPIANMYSFQSARKRERKLVERAGEIASMLGITDELDVVVKQLPYGIQKRVEIARALAGDPKLILLDEPVAGCNDEETSELREVIRKVNRDLNITILMVEHDMSMVMSVCDYIFVLNFGSNLVEGTPAQIRTNPEVIKAYLGQEEET